MTSPSILQILIRFLRLGMTAFGGPAMVPYIRAMAVDREGWLNEKTFKLGMSLAQAIPGATAMQMAAYVGLRARGGPGALAAYFAFGLPAFILMLALSMLYFSAQDIPIIKAAFSGLQLVVVALIFHAAINFSKRYLNTLTAKFLACAAGIWLGLKGNPILALIGICFLSILLFKQEQGGTSPPQKGHGRANPFLSALVFSLLFIAFLIGLYWYDPKLFNLGLLMAKIDCFAYGGGYVSVPIMLHEVVEVRGWLDNAQFMDGIALGQITPGPIVMTGAFVGYSVAGLAGAVVATIGVFTPSLIFICLATEFGDRLTASPFARRALKGSLITLVGLMAAVAAQFAIHTDWSPLRVAISLGSFLALRSGIDILKVVLCGAAVSAVLL